MSASQKEFVKLVTENQRMIHKVCRIYTNCWDDHQDLFQEITIQLWKSFGGFRGDAKFSTWMYRIALNTALSLYRKGSRKIAINDEVDFAQIRVSQEDYHDDEEHLQMMYKAIYQLSDIDKALIMMYLDDKSYREIGELLGITEGNARVKMNRAKNTLKSLIVKNTSTWTS